MRKSAKLTLALAVLGVLVSIVGCKPAQSRDYETGDGIPAVPSNTANSNLAAQNDL